VFIKQKGNKRINGLRQTQRYILFYFYLDDMFQSTGHHQNFKVGAEPITFM